MQHRLLTAMLALGLLLAAAPASAQFIGCDDDTNPCTETLYGLGNDTVEGPHNETTAVVRLGPADGSCGPEFESRIGGADPDSRAGQLRRVVRRARVAWSRSRRSSADSGYLQPTASSTLDPSVPIGVVAFAVANLTDMAGNIGFRELSGTCGVSGDDCALDSAVRRPEPGGRRATSTCFSDPENRLLRRRTTLACPNLDCRTEIELGRNWPLHRQGDRLHLGRRLLAVKTFAFAGLEWADSETCRVCAVRAPAAWIVCPLHSSTVGEYPVGHVRLDPASREPCRMRATGSSKGGREHALRSTDWSSRSRVSRRASVTRTASGRAETSATSGPAVRQRQVHQCDPTCAGSIPFDPANPALPSPCDDVDFGGIAGRLL